MGDHPVLDDPAVDEDVLPVAARQRVRRSPGEAAAWPNPDASAGNAREQERTSARFLGPSGCQLPNSELVEEPGDRVGEDLVVLGEEGGGFACPVHHVAHHVLAGIELGLLVEQPHLGALFREGFAVELRILAGHFSGVFGFA